MGELAAIEPSVIGWMPAAQLYFADRDGHALEFIALLNDPADPDFVGPLSTWQRKRSLALAQNTNPLFHGNQPT